MKVFLVCSGSDYRSSLILKDSKTIQKHYILRNSFENPCLGRDYTSCQIWDVLKNCISFGKLIPGITLSFPPGGKYRQLQVIAALGCQRQGWHHCCSTAESHLSITSLHLALWFLQLQNIEISWYFCCGPGCCGQFQPAARRDHAEQWQSHGYWNGAPHHLECHGIEPNASTARRFRPREISFQSKILQLAFLCNVSKSRPRNSSPQKSSPIHSRNPGGTCDSAIGCPWPSTLQRMWLMTWVHDQEISEISFQCKNKNKIFISFHFISLIFHASMT